MRINYAEEEDFGGQFGLWHANCQRSLKGKKGQRSLAELEIALLALPDKRLIANELENEDGEVCALGALAKHKGLITDAMREIAEYEMEEVGVMLGMPHLVAWKVVELNDIELGDVPWQWHKEPSVTPERRYELTLAWVQRQLGKTAIACRG